jgi:adenine-specific DNA-methyltransferase
MHECPIQFSDKVGQEFFSVNSEKKSELGQYFTPHEVADFMAAMLRPVNKSVIRILDPGAGSGVLASAAVKALIRHCHQKTTQFHVDLFEIDPNLIPKLKMSLDHLAAWCLGHGKKLTFEVKSEDFVLRCSSAIERQPSLFHNNEEYDVVISNPPYFKISKDDPRALACSRIVYGQPNIYALFMAISAGLLGKDGQILFITPRSFASGQYFKAFRKYFLSEISLQKIHQFASRVDAFDRDKVLQENIITYGVKEKHDPSTIVSISSSNGRSDLSFPLSLEIEKSELLSDQNDLTIPLPSNPKDLSVMRLFRSWSNSLANMGLKISTGPVVPFRATEFIAFEEAEATVPLYWIQHVKPMQTHFPLATFRKQQWIKHTAQSEKLFVKNQNMILMRRFSPKEDFRRMTIAPFASKAFAGDYIGLENHLNYIYKPDGNFSEFEMVGLASFFSSELFDSYFRILNGNTQVSATELRSTPLPDQDVLTEIGRLITKAKERTHDVIDAVVNEIIEHEVTSEQN